MSDPASSPAPLGKRLARVLVFGRRPGWTLIRIGVLVLAAVLIFGFVLMPIQIQGVSMFPMAKEGEIHCVNRLAYLSHAPARFHVVALRPVKGGPVLLKRVIGLPGEVVEMRRGVPHVDGQALEEPYVRGRGTWEEHPVKLGPEQYLVMGDNRSMERASHSHGYAERWMIVGRLWF